MHAVSSGSLGEVTSQLAQGADINASDDEGLTALHFAAIEQNPEIIDALISHGADVNVVDKYGNTPLARAVFYYRGSTDVIPLLLNAGSDPEKQNLHGVSPKSLAHDIANYDVKKFF